MQLNKNSLYLKKLQKFKCNFISISKYSVGAKNDDAIITKTILEKGLTQGQLCKFNGYKNWNQIGVKLQRGRKNVLPTQVCKIKL